MTTRSTFGTQPLSVKRTSPAFGFGACSREQANKLFVSNTHTMLATAGTHSPGPVYTLPKSIGGKQPDGRKPDAPVWAIGKAARFRPHSAPNNLSPGPGHYKTPQASVGQQVLGRFRTEPLAGFGTAERRHVRKVFVSNDHQKTDMHGLDSPGPMMYSLKSTMGKQENSKIRNPPSWAFSTSSRIDKAEEKAAASLPGPAKYSLPEAVGPQVDSKKPRAPTPGFGASTRDVRSKIYLGPVLRDLGRQLIVRLAHVLHLSLEVVDRHAVLVPLGLVHLELRTQRYCGWRSGSGRSHGC